VDDRACIRALPWCEEDLRRKCYTGGLGVLNGGLRGGGEGTGYAKAAGLMSTIMGLSLRLNYVCPTLLCYTSKLSRSPIHMRTASAPAPL
jgi:hypothetical protein